MSTPPPAGWYDDPTMVNTRRYWDGTAWTDHIQEKPATPATPVPPGPGEEHAMNDRLRQSRPLLILLGVLVVLGILGGAWLLTTQGPDDSGSGSTDDTYTSADLAKEIESGLAEQGEPGASITCDAVSSNPAAGDKNACRGTLSSGDPVNILVTYNSDGTFLWEVK